MPRATGKAGCRRPNRFAYPATEWEKAARGTDGWIYPWGNLWDKERANTAESGIGVTSPVGCYPQGASPYGAFDMSGNASEWTATPWVMGYHNRDGTEIELSEVVYL